MSWHAVWWQKHDKSNQRWSENQMCKYIYTMNKSFAPFSEEKKGDFDSFCRCDHYIFSRTISHQLFGLLAKWSYKRHLRLISCKSCVYIYDHWTRYRMEPKRRQVIIRAISDIIRWRLYASFCFYGNLMWSALFQSSDLIPQMFLLGLLTIISSGPMQYGRHHTDNSCEWIVEMPPLTKIEKNTSSEPIAAYFADA